MLQQVNDGFAPDRERVADANASVPTIDIAAFASGDAGAPPECSRRGEAGL